MKIGILGDIHGNSFALERVLVEARRQRVEHLLVVGDIVGYYYYPERVLEMLGEWNWTFIRGNHEDLLRDILSGETNEEHVRRKYGSGHLKAIEKLNKDQLEFLTTASEKAVVAFDELQLLLCHGSPWKSDYYLYPDTPKQILDQCKIEAIDVVAVGHSHYSFLFQAGSTLLLNPGSVGQSRIMGGVASWAILNTENRTVVIAATPYNVSELINAVETFDPQVPYLKSILLRNNP
jgi:putative phosphoesterase